MDKGICIGEILQNKEVQYNHFLMRIKVSASFYQPKPGQFVMLRIAGLSEPFLGRPISIYSFHRKKSSAEMEILYRIAGKGTQVMAGLIRGSQLEIHGPLGSGFNIFPEKEKIVFIAGGIGIAPLSLLAQYLSHEGCIASSRMNFYLGAQTSRAVVGLDKISELCYNIHVCTDDGTLGKESLVTQAFLQDMKKFDPANTIIYACGPKPMLRALAGIISRKQYVCQVSLEERMACGTGACMGCAVAIKDSQSNLSYKRVCSDGPVFHLEDVLWE